MQDQRHTLLSRDELLPRVLARQAVENAERVFIEEVAGRCMTYAEFHETALTWADAFRRLGVGPGEMVATKVPATVE
jgi:acyl-CoA synthetase (AMP-forming)/AMP-acid ligase II